MSYDDVRNIVDTGREVRNRGLGAFHVLDDRTVIAILRLLSDHDLLQCGLLPAACLLPPASILRSNLQDVPGEPSFLLLRRR